MGLNTEQVYSHQALEWPHTLQQSSSPELSKPPLTPPRQPLQQHSTPLKCPRCSSTNTKFCYYNNYNKSQPRYFCKACKRHWTQGGTLRNVPVGGARKTKRPKISNAATPTAVNSFQLQQSGTNSSLSYQTLMRSSSPLQQNSTWTNKDINLSTFEKALVGRNDRINSTGLTVSLSAQPHDQKTEFSLVSSLTSFDTKNTSLNINSPYYQELNASAIDSFEESTITMLTIPAISSVPWPLLDNWNVNTNDGLISSDLNISWNDEDDLEIKP